ncbi:MAG: hypothetical protein J7L19_01955 [Dehalococcoidia bacterium]|nr:hypothetical protein [Dehalococcoidia bacterium]
MIRQNKYIWLTIILVALLLPSPALAWSFSIIPPEIKIDNISPGQEAEFNFTIHNKDDINHTFILTTYAPEEPGRRLERTEFPDATWLSFPRQVEVQANSETKANVKVAIPAQQEWSSKNWEIWLSVTPQDKDFLVVNYYIRLLISTGEGGEGIEVGSHKVEGNSRIVLIMEVVILLLLGYSIYYFRRKEKSK